jgi:uncharacterized membrane protein
MEVDNDIARARMRNKAQMSIQFKVAITGVLTALETVATMMLAITIPASNGYFNVGEALIYFTAICFGPVIGAFVGGVGAALADILLGYTVFAPGTFVIKGSEGYLVGFVYQFLHKNERIRKHWKQFTVVLGLIVGGLMIGIGRESIVFIVLGVVLMGAILVLGFTMKETTVRMVFAMVCGGVVMVIGYYLYGIPLFGAEVALIEIPFNCLQVLLGILIALPIITTLKPFLKSYVDIED